MIRNYLKIAIRHLFGNKTYSIINIIGLAIGISCTAMILLWVIDEINFDDFHENKDRIYRVIVQQKGKEEFIAKTPGKLAETIKNEIPEIQYACRIIQNHRNPFRYNNKSYYESRSYCVDPDFFKIFSFPIIKGNIDKPFDSPNHIIISESTASKYFGTENPINKKLSWNNRSDYSVSGVFKNMPANSHLQMDIIESHNLSAKYWKSGYSWTNFVHMTYILLQPDVSPKNIEKKIEVILNKHCHIFERYFNIKLHPLNDIYLNADITTGGVLSSDRKYVNIFAIIAVIILGIACINFINISIASSLSRSSEIGIRKVLGTQRVNIFYQFLGEYFLLTVLASIISIFFLKIFLPYFNSFTGKDLSYGIGFYTLFPSIVILTAIIVSCYPALILSRYSPRLIFNNDKLNKTKKISLRSILVILQFTISIGLIICTLVIRQQLSYIQNKNLGFDKEQVIYIPAKSQFGKKFQIVKNEILKNSSIKYIAMKDYAPTKTIQGGWVTWSGQQKQDVVIRNMRVTQDYFSTLSIGLIKGRIFSDKRKSDFNSFVINEAAVKRLGFENPIGKTIKTAGRKGQIIGIVENTYFKSLHHQIEPLIFMILKDYGSVDIFGVYLIKFYGNDRPAIIENLKNIWNNYNPEIPFEYHFLDQTIEAKYGFEYRLNKIFSGFSMLAIFISAIGLFGLVTFMMKKRLKEISIRKVMGASVERIVILLSVDFMKWVLIANLIAWPLAWIIVTNWLNNFAYRIELSIWPFIISGIISFVITFVTIFSKTMIAATSNPAEVLKNE